MTYNSIKNYIQLVKIDFNQLNAILANINKMYLVYYKNNFYLDKTMLNHNIEIKYELNRTHNSIVYYLSNGQLLYITIYWKNNTGVLVPIWKLRLKKKKWTIIISIQKFNYQKLT